MLDGRESGPLLLVTGDSPDRGEKSFIVEAFLFTKFGLFIYEAAGVQSYTLPSCTVMKKRCSCIMAMFIILLQRHTQTWGYISCTCRRDGEQALTCLCPAFSDWMMLCQLCDCLHGVNKWTRMKPVTFSEAHMPLEILTLPPKHSNIHRQAQKNATTQWQKARQVHQISHPVLNLTFKPNVRW